MFLLMCFKDIDNILKLLVMMCLILLIIRSDNEPTTMVLTVNVPSISFGLAMGWVSLESGDETDDKTGMALVGAAAVTFLAGAVATPLAARAIAAGRKPAMLATSAAFIVCWSAKLCGGWGIVVGRAAAGLGGTAAWVIPPMLANEMCCSQVRGAAAVALVLAHNVGFLLMYLAADYDIPHRIVLLCCLGLSVVHFIAYIFVPESPAYLAANGKYKEAREALAWCRGYSDSTGSELDVELKALPEPDLEPVSPFRLAKDMLSDIRRRKAFIIALVSVVGQEMCGVLTLLQFAERVFALASHGEEEEKGRKAASDAVVLGAVQLVASALALYLVEKIGRRLLLVWGAIATGACLGLGAGAVWAGSRLGALVALATAVFADSAGLQPAPYALLAEMFTYQYRGCASLLITAASDLGNAVEIVVFPSIVHAAGLVVALAVASVLTLILAVYSFYTVPETMDRTPEEIYEILCPGLVDNPSDVNVVKSKNDDISNDVNDDKSHKEEEVKSNDVDKCAIKDNGSNAENNQNKDFATIQYDIVEKNEAITNNIEKDHIVRGTLINDNKINNEQEPESTNDFIDDGTDFNEQGRRIDASNTNIKCKKIQNDHNSSKNSKNDVNDSHITQENNRNEISNIETVDKSKPVISKAGSNENDI